VKPRAAPKDLPLPAALDAAGVLALGGFRLDLAAGELRSPDGELAALRRQALAVLLALGREAGRVVTKDRLMAQVWPGVVVGEGSLTQAVADIRRVLGDPGHRLVRNVARRGYLLCADATPDPVPTSAAEAPALSIAVMPLLPQGMPADEHWLADALHGELITEVSRLIGSLVIARDTMVSYQGRAADPRAVARELGVRHIVRGSLRLEGQHYRLNLALVDGHSGAQRWADIFVAERQGLPLALGEFATQVERALQAELYRAAVRRPGPMLQPPSDAEELAMQAYALWFRGCRQGHVLEALPLLQQAVALDADCARAWAGLAFMRAVAYAQGWAGTLPQVLAQVDEAVAQLDRLDRDGHYTDQSKFIALYLRGQQQAMRVQAEAWCERHPRPTAFGSLGAVQLMHGEFDAAVESLQRALRLSPRDPIRADWQHRLAMAHLAAGRLELAHDWSQRAEGSSPGLAWPPIRVAALALQGRLDDARRAGDSAGQRPAAELAQAIDRLLPGDGLDWRQARARLEHGLALARAAAG
jgi:TolB-like protein